MSQQDITITMALKAWETHVKRLNTLFDGLTDEELFTELAPGKNRAVYILGHLTAVNDMMLPLLGLGQREFVHLDEAFLTHPDRTVKDLPPVPEIRAHWTKSNETLSGSLKRVTTEDWFARHNSVSEEDFAKEPHRNKLSVLLSRTNHLASHLGQLVLLKK